MDVIATKTIPAHQVRLNITQAADAFDSFTNALQVLSNLSTQLTKYTSLDQLYRL